MSKAARPNTNAAAIDDDGGKVRLDKWLWAARFFKTRGLAADAIEGGRIRLKSERVKLSHAVRVGEHYSVSQDGFLWEILITAISDQRGNATAAALLYRESPESIEARALEVAKRKAAFSAGATFNHRPTKRDRRDLIKYFQPKD